MVAVFLVLYLTLTIFELDFIKFSTLVVVLLLMPPEFAV